MSDQVPIISLSTDRPQQGIVDDIRAACLTFGFFQVTDYAHIVPPDLPRNALEMSRRFFQLSLDVKQSLYKVDHIAGGYEPYKAMNLNPADKQGYGHNEGFSFAAAPHPTAWPDESIIPGFRACMDEYDEGVSSLATQLGRYIAMGLGLSESYFDDFFQGQLAHVKLAHYYRPQGVGSITSGVGVAPHTDWGAITILLQDDVGGLEVFDHNLRWIKVPTKPDAFVVNLGDLLQRWTNDLYKSTKHRGRPDYVVTAIESCLQPGMGAKYSPIKAEAYLKFKFESTHSTLSKSL